MGSGSSQELAGVRVFKVSPGSPAAEAGLEAFFDFIVEVDGAPMNDLEHQKAFSGKIAEAENSTAKLVVYNTRAQSEREVMVMPRKWDGNGLLGATVRYDVIDPAENHGIRVLEVIPNSPAAHAGLVPFQDFLLGTAASVFHDIDELIDVVSANINQKMQVFVYNSDSETVREVTFAPNSDWGGEGCIGCDIGTGLLHRVPAPRRPPGVAPPVQAPFRAPAAVAPVSVQPNAPPRPAEMPAAPPPGVAAPVPAPAAPVAVQPVMSQAAVLGPAADIASVPPGVQLPPSDAVVGVAPPGVAPPAAPPTAPPPESQAALPAVTHVEPVPAVAAPIVAPGSYVPGSQTVPVAAPADVPAPASVVETPSLMTPKKLAGVWPPPKQPKEEPERPPIEAQAPQAQAEQAVPAGVQATAPGAAVL